MVRRSNGLYAFHATPTAKAARTLLSGVRGRRPMRWRVEVLDLDGVPVAQLAARLSSVTWRVDGYGQAEFTLSRDEMLRLGPVLQPSHWFAVRFDHMPSWVGVIAPPADYTTQEAKLRAFTPEWLLQYDLTAANYAKTGVWAQASTLTAADLLNYNEILRKWYVAPVYRGDSEPVEVTFSYATLAKALERIRELDPEFHYRFDCGYEGGQLQIKPRLWRGAWRDLTRSVCLRQGTNISEATVVTQGPIVNDVIVAPSGAKFNEKPWLFQRQLNHDSARQFGARREFVALTEPKTEDVATLGNYARQYVAVRGRERLRLQATMLDTGPARFGEYWLGDRVTVELPRVGRRGYTMAAMIVALEFTAEGKLAAVFEEEIERAQ